MFIRRLSIYFKNWFDATIESDAPYNDLLFLKSLIKYSCVANIAIKKFKEHIFGTFRKNYRVAGIVL